MKLSLNAGERKAILKTVMAGAMIAAAGTQAQANGCDSQHQWACSWNCINACGGLSQCINCTDNFSYTCTYCS